MTDENGGNGREKPTTFETMKVMASDLSMLGRPFRGLGAKAANAVFATGRYFGSLGKSYAGKQLALSCIPYGGKFLQRVDISEKSNAEYYGAQVGEVLGIMQDTISIGIVVMQGMLYDLFIRPPDDNLISMLEHPEEELARLSARNAEISQTIDNVVLGAEVYVGAKIATNLVALGISWYRGAQERAR